MNFLCECRSGGWYRYDVFFSIPVQVEKEKEIRWNYYKATMVVKINAKGFFFYDIINIKKEARTPGGSSKWGYTR